jgi:putative SOS response-associated peptidase YedK
MVDDSAFAFAGLWDRWEDGTGKVVESCSVLTTMPNSLLSDVHDRMPVILGSDCYELWLDPGFRDLESLRAMLKPFAAGTMKRYAVSARVNAVVNDDSACISPAPDAGTSGQQLSLL